MMIFTKTIFIFKLALLTFLISGCTRDIPTKQQRIQTLQNLVPQSSFITKTIQTHSYSFYTIQQKESCKNVHVYFEGDGLAWITKRLVSDDPTPLTPTTFKLLLQDESQCKVYIARACQYTNDPLCNEEDWTTHRFSKRIVNATNEAIDQIKQNYQNDSFTFIGYSGGAAIASLVANKRDDVINFVSVAGNLDTQLWTTIKRFQPLTGSLNPVNYTNNLQKVKHYHIIGKNDEVIPYEIIQSYMKQFDDKQNITLKRVEATHGCCYESVFKEIIKTIY